MANALEDKRALVTGAASGIGRAAAVALMEAGARVVGFDLKPSRADSFDIVEVDVSAEAAVEYGMREAARRLGALDIVVNNAGIALSSPLAELDLAGLDRMYAVNVRGTFLVVRAALPLLRKGARIINIASELAHLGRAGSSGYCASKGAVVSLTRAWARELAPDVLVNAVAPGPTDTPLLGFESLTPEIRALELANPLQRIGAAAEIAAAVVFLASPGASFITGHCLGVDGGAAMR